jgi:ABC-type lipoprotein export system ATPase subunit
MVSEAVLACVSGLSYRYAPHEPLVLRDISLTIREGEIVVLTGASGSGKTTLLSLLGMMRRVEPGHIRLFNTDVGTAGALEIAALRRRVRFIFQKHYLLRSLTALQNVIAGVVANVTTDRHWNETSAQGLLTALELGDHASKWPDQLSVGQSAAGGGCPIARRFAGFAARRRTDRIARSYVGASCYRPDQRSSPDNALRGPDINP